MKLCQFRAAFTISALLTVLLVRRSVAECRLEYTWQPPSTTPEDCNPYQSVGQTSTVRVILQCSVRRQTGVTDKLDLRWFRENTTVAVEDLGTGSTIRTLDGRELVSQYHETVLLNQQYNRSFLSKYWCQVINTTADPDQPLMRSNVFTLLAPENYIGSTCSGVSQFLTVANTTCADLHTQSVQTSLPVPATITDTQKMTAAHSTQQSPSTAVISTQQSPSSISIQQSPSSVSTSPVSSTVTYVVVATVLVVLVVSVTVITMVTVLVYKRCSRKQKTGQATSAQGEGIRSVQVQNQIPPNEPQYFNPHYFTAIALSSPDYDEAEEHIRQAQYQSLHTDTRDYTSVYTEAGRRKDPSVEVEGNLYSIVDPTRIEGEHTYTTPQ